MPAVKGLPEGFLSWKAEESEELKREKEEHGAFDYSATSFSAVESSSSLVEEIGAFDLGEEDDHREDVVQKGFYSVGGNKMIPESPEEIIGVEIGTTRTAAEMISLTSDRNDMEEKNQQMKNFTAVAESDVLSDATITPEVLSASDKSTSLSPNSSASRSESVVDFGSESADRKQSSSDLKLTSTDLRRESLAHESEPESSNLISEDSDLTSESFGRKSESVEHVPESFALSHNAAFSKPESSVLTPETIDPISDSSPSKSESVRALPESVDSSPKSDSVVSIFSKPVDSDHGTSTVVVESGRENLTPDSLNNDLYSANPKEESFKEEEQMSPDSMTGATGGRELFSPVPDYREFADGVDVTVGRSNSDASQPEVDDAEPAFDDSFTKPESGEELIGLSVNSSQSPTVDTVAETETLTLSSPTLLLPQAVLKQYCHHSRDDLIQIVLGQQRELREKEAHIHDLENYIDNLLVKVLDVQPRILGALEQDGATTSSPPSTPQSAGKSSLPSRTGSVESETYVAYQKVTTETSGPAHITMVTSPKPATKKPGFLNVLKAKK